MNNVIPVTKGDLEGENGTEVKLTKKDINKSFMTWYMLCEVSNSFERMQSLAFCASMTPVLKKIYKTEEELNAALARHLVFFNTQGTWGTLIHGITIAMEEQKANKKDVSDSAITGIKTGLMGPFAGIGDTIDWGTLKPIIFALAVSFGAVGSVLGAFIPFLFVVITVAEGYLLWNFGYSVGRESVKSILKSGWIKELITGASILGLFMMGALTANFVKLNIPISIRMAEGDNLKVQELLDSIAPGILPLVVTLAIYWYLKNRGFKITHVLLIIIIVSMLGAFLGIF